MKNLKNIRSLALLFWIVAIVVAVVTMPDLERLGQEKGQINLPADLESEKAATILNEMKHDGEATYDLAIVFHNKDGLKNDEKAEMDESLAYFKEHEADYHIVNTMFYNDSEQTEKQLVSEDGTTIINQFTVEKGLKSASDVAADIESKLEDLSVDTYITGSEIVIDDFSKTSQEGVKKTEIIAIIFIIVILIIVFRSPVVPFVSLITVGISYIVSLNIIAQLVKYFDFPFSDFTQVFLVVILFGIGTDYNILLLTRFREELGKQNHIVKAMLATYKTAGRTVLYSAIAVLFGLSALFFAEFSFYQATGGVAIGVLVLVFVLFTLNPFFMGLLGMKMFWPKKNVKSHSDNKLWAFLAKHSFARSIISLILVAILVVPAILMYSGNLNFNDLNEIDNKYESKQAINIISDHFPAGMSSPTTLVIKNDEKLTDMASLQEIDRLTARLKEIDGVDKVYSVTRPENEQIKELYLQNQLNTLSDNLNKMENGTNDVRVGLENGANESTASTTKVMEQLPAEIANQMAAQAKGQVSQLNSATEGLKEIEVGLNQSKQYIEETGQENKDVLNIPDDVLTGKDFSESIHIYMNEEQNTTTMTIILKDNPYSAEAMNVIEETQSVVHAFMKGSSLHEADAYLGGKTMSNVDLSNMSNKDFKRSIVIILIGISIMLLFITRSIAQTVVILISLVVASFASLGLTEWFAKTFLDVDTLSWNVPFFAYIMLITLGVDYSIFLMMRYRENKRNQLEFIVDASKKMGGVILSAALILGGTFAALIPSGINTLIQVAIAVIIGIAWLSLILMPIFIPASFGLGKLMNKENDEK